MRFGKFVSENISFGLIFLGSNGQIRDENSVVHASVSIYTRNRMQLHGETGGRGGGAL